MTKPSYMDCWYFIAPLLPVNTDFERGVYIMVFRALKEAEGKRRKSESIPPDTSPPGGIDGMLAGIITKQVGSTANERYRLGSRH